MNYIIMDIEWNTFRYHTTKPEEIIEIGAVKVNSNNKNVVAHFSSLVKPSVELSEWTHKLTGIQQEDLEYAPSFVQAYNAFKEFLGEDYTMVTWGKEDERLLNLECERNNVSNISMNKHIDLQLLIFNAFGNMFTDLPSLKFATEKFKLDWDGNSHRAFDDAFNTTKLFLTVDSKIDINQPYNHNNPYFAKGGILNKETRLIVKDTIYNSMISKNNLKMNWDEFSKSEYWIGISSSFEFDEIMMKIFERELTYLAKKVRTMIKSEQQNIKKSHII